MSALRLRPLRRILLGAALCLAGASAATGWWVLMDIGRREPSPGHPLPDALRAAATVETARLQAALRASLDKVEAVLVPAVQLGEKVDADAAIPWVPGMCDVQWPPSVVRAGLWDLSMHAPLSLVELTGGRCLDRVGMQAFQALSGPPFPAAADVMRVAQSAAPGVDLAAHGRTIAVTAYREGTVALVRLARRQFARAAWADLRLDATPAPPSLPGVRMDSLLLLDGVVVGYVHGGPEGGALQGALDDVSSGKARALDLQEVARSTAARGAVALLHPELDTEELALGSSTLLLDSPAGRMELLVVASAPWPVPPASLALRVAAISGGALLLLALLSLLFARRLSGALWRSAGEVREAWLGLRDDDEDSADDRARALRLLEGMSQGTRESLEAAYGKGERFWAPAPVGRLIDLLRRKLQGP